MIEKILRKDKVSKVKVINEHSEIGVFSDAGRQYYYYNEEEYLRHQGRTSYPKPKISSNTKNSNGVFSNLSTFNNLNKAHYSPKTTEDKLEDELVLNIIMKAFVKEVGGQSSTKLLNKAASMKKYRVNFSEFSPINEF